MRLVLAILSLAFLSSYASENNRDSNLILPVSVQKGPNTEDLHDSKFEAALNLTVEFAGRESLVSISKRDSIIADFAKQGKEITAIELANLMDAKKLAFVGVNRLANILRIELVFESSDTLQNDKKSGVGYANIKYRRSGSDEILYDPAILEAMQRAYIEVMGIDTLYSGLDSPFDVGPAKPLVIGALVFVDDEQSKKWNIYETKEIASYSAVEAMFDVAYKSKDFVVYDTESRDSLFALNRMYAIENHSPPTRLEIIALYNMEVDYYIAGVLKRVNDAAELTLSLYEINRESLLPLVTEQTFLEKDDMKELGDLVEKLTAILLRIDLEE